MSKIYTDPSTPQFAEFLSKLPEIFDKEGEIIYKGRNILKRFIVCGERIIVKSYRKPIWFNRIIYRFFRKPKAQRSCEYAKLLLNNDIGSPKPVGYHIETRGLLIGRTFYACLESRLRFTYRDLNTQNFPERNEILRAVAHTTAMLHQKGILHKDYSAGNILFDKVDGQLLIDIIDLNRIRFYKNIDLEKGIRNFDRLPGTQEMLRVMSDAYANIRGLDPERCWKIMQETHGTDNKYIR